MEQITVRLEADTIAELEAEAGEHDRSRSAHIRDVIASRHTTDADVEALRDRVGELEADREKLRSEVESLESDVERLRREKRLILEERDEKEALVRYVETERTAEQRWREAGLATRVKWRLTGMPGDADSEG